MSKRNKQNEGTTGASAGAPSSVSKQDAKSSGSDSNVDEEAEKLQQMLGGNDSKKSETISDDKTNQPPGGASKVSESKNSKPDVAEVTKPKLSKNGERYFVEDGKAVTTRKGVRGEHQEVLSEYVGGVDHLEKLVKRGLVYKAKFARTEKGARESDLAGRVQDAKKAK